MRDGSGKIIGLIGISRDVRAPIETHDIPVEFAAALDHFENNVADSVTPSALAANETHLRTDAQPVHRQNPHRACCARHSFP